MAALPTPVTTTDELLAAVHAELVGLRADLASAGGGERDAAHVPGEPVLLEEPKPAVLPRKSARSTR